MDSKLLWLRYFDGCVCHNNVNIHDDYNLNEILLYLVGNDRPHINGRMKDKDKDEDETMRAFRYNIWDIQTEMKRYGQQ